MDEMMFLKLVPLIKSAIKKYTYSNLEYDDLFQIGSMALVKSYSKYDANKGMKLTSFLYKCILWEINKELQLQKDKAIDTFISSIYEPIGDGDDLKVEDMLEDISVQVEKTVTDKIILEEYYNEITRVLSPDKANICIMKWFENKSLKEIKKETGKNNIPGILRQSRMELLQKSKMIKEAYMDFIQHEVL